MGNGFLERPRFLEGSNNHLMDSGGPGGSKLFWAVCVLEAGEVAVTEKSCTEHTGRLACASTRCPNVPAYIGPSGCLGRPGYVFTWSKCPLSQACVMQHEWFFSVGISSAR